ncbi:EAL domain-containing protein [Meiothermus granaticius]|uniref:Putative signaling protein n=1 Tax=Meiothermus granaticius NBRC 107808 TaxID=1227551 RepID=A0A399F8Z9_9DEIN|nr:EAL domain-containing protein [Meiothermus granaticius]RIH93124.1 putative signaling protein [Meiothermus granaticius NBRC 107808]GEM88015.1 hypothetical protein MGR01S_26400 [Meiothermus granaticius NBRC 107808]
MSARKLPSHRSPHTLPEGFDLLEATHSLMVVCTDLEGRFTYANRAYLEYMGLPEPPLGSSALEQVAAEDLPRVLEAIRKVLAQPGQALWVELSKPLEGAWNRSRWEFVAICDPQGHPVGVQCAGYDISKEYRQARFLEASTHLLSLGLKGVLSAEALLQQALDAALAVVPAAQAGSATLRQPDGKFRFVAARGYDLTALREAYLSPQELLWRSRHIQARVFSQADLERFDAALDPERQALLWGPGRTGSIQAMLAIPVVVEGQPRAYLYLDHFDRAEAFDPLDLHHAEGLAHHVAWLLFGGELRKKAYLSRYADFQTGLPNTRSLREALEKLPPGPRALLALQCRSLERIQRLEGEAVWATVVRELGHSLQRRLRPTDRLAFKEGTFWLLLEGVQKAEEVYAVLGRLKGEVRVELEARWPQLDFSPRVGVVLAEPNQSPPELLQAAKVALEQSHHPDSISVFNPTLAARTREGDSLRQALSQALRRRRAESPPDGFALHYQPIKTLTDQRLHHFEALLRWTVPELGPIPPGKFLPLAEEEGWMPELGDWVVKVAAQQSARWGIPVAVNLSGSQLEPDLLHRVSVYLERYRLSPQQLIFEVTEQVILEESSLELLQSLVAGGHPLHLDDFGSGLSSLERLTRLPLAAVKLDRGFVANLGLTPHRETPEARLLRALRGLGSSLGVDLIVEGIETPEQLEFLLAEGFALGQGFLLGRPAIYSEAEVQQLRGGSDRA